MARSTKKVVEMPALYGVEIYPDIRVLVIRDRVLGAEFMLFYLELIKWGGTGWIFLPPAGQGLQVAASAPWPEGEGEGAYRKPGYIQGHERKKR